MTSWAKLTAPQIGETPQFGRAVPQIFTTVAGNEVQRLTFPLGISNGTQFTLSYQPTGQNPNLGTTFLWSNTTATLQDNIRIANCTTAAQFFHLLRRQALDAAHYLRANVVFGQQFQRNFHCLLQADTPRLDQRLAVVAGYQAIMDDEPFS